MTNGRFVGMCVAGFFTVGPALADEADGLTDVATHAPQPEVVDLTPALSNAALVALDMPDVPGEPFTVVVPIDGESFTLELAPHSVRAPGYQLKYQIEDGSIIHGVPGMVRTLRGTVVEVPGSIVAASLLKTGLTADIFFPDELGSLRIEPWPTLPANQYIVYRPERASQGTGQCATDVLVQGEHDADAPAGGPRGAACGTGLCIAQLGIDADFEYFQTHGSSVPQTEAAIEAVINTVNIQFETDTDITHLITAIVVRSSEPDPYSSSDFATLLTQFRVEWLNNQGDIPYDLAELFTGKNMDGGIVGGGMGIGVICTDNAFCLVESDFTSVFDCSTDLTAHQFGHLWGAFHCACPGYTMDSIGTCANDFHETLTVPDIVAHRDSLDCLDGGVAIPCEGDANGDGLVDPLDSGFVLARFGCPVGTGDPGCDSADMNGDGLVDPLDAGFVRARFGPCP